MKKVIVLVAILVIVAVVFLVGKFGVVERLMPDVEIKGEVFIVMKDGASVKLGLVPVGLFTEEVMKGFCADKEIAVSNALAVLEPDLESAFKEHNNLQDQELAALDLCIKHLDKSPKYDREGKDGINIKALEEYQRLTRVWENEEKELKMKQDKLNKQKEKAWDRYMYLSAEGKKYNSVSFRLKDLPVPLCEVKTNADGKFILKVPVTGRFIIVAKASRSVGDEVDTYGWGIPVTEQLRKEKRIMLSNDNWMTCSE